MPGATLGHSTRSLESFLTAGLGPIEACVEVPTTLGHDFEERREARGLVEPFAPSLRCVVDEYQRRIRSTHVVRQAFRCSIPADVDQADVDKSRHRVAAPVIPLPAGGSDHTAIGGGVHRLPKARKLLRTTRQRPGSYGCPGTFLVGVVDEVDGVALPVLVRAVARYAVGRAAARLEEAH